MAMADLAAHQADWVGTIQQRFGDSVIHEIPPNGHGIAALMATAERTEPIHFNAVSDALNIAEGRLTL